MVCWWTVHSSNGPPGRGGAEWEEWQVRFTNRQRYAQRGIPVDGLHIKLSGHTQVLLVFRQLVTGNHPGILIVAVMNRKTPKSDDLRGYQVNRWFCVMRGSLIKEHAHKASKRGK